MYQYFFIKFVVAFLVGILSFYSFLEPVFVIPIGLFIIFIIYIIQRFFALSLMIWFIAWLIGFLLAFSSYHLRAVVDHNYLNLPVQIVGKVINLPEIGYSMHGVKKASFLFEIHQIKNTTDSHRYFLKPKIKLSWYEGRKDFLPEIITGQKWCLPVKLKSNHSSINPKAFDYEQYLFTQDIVARGSVNTRNSAFQLLEEHGFDLRFWLSNQIDKTFKNSTNLALYKALLIGDKSKINAQQWEVLEKTGTIHLMAISGLHIGIMALLGFVLFGWLWRVLIRYSAKIRKIPKVLFSAVAVLFLISFYLYISGAAVSTQRAWIMAAVFILLLFLRRKFQPWSALSLSAIAVVIWQPSSVLNTGFWLSFGAVFLIFLTLQQPRVKPLKVWQKTILIQFVLTLGMIPLLAFYFQQIPFISSVANLIAVPVVSILALPFLFLTLISNLILMDLYPPLAFFVVQVNDFIWHYLWLFLTQVSTISSGLNNGFWALGRVEIWQVSLVYLIWFMLYRFKIKLRIALPLAIISFFILIALLSIWNVDRPTKQGEIKLTVLDVGQGQALVMETKNHTVVYDTGAKWGAKLDGAKLALLPYLKQQKVNEIDLLMVSHGDLDHSGGVVSLLKKVKALEKVSGQARKLNKLARRNDFTDCHQKKWVFDEVLFSVISRPKEKASDNNRSCVLQITTGTQSIMIMGDVSKKIEKTLIKRHGNSLQSGILIAGHHGSNTSTSNDWLKIVKPTMVVFVTGYKNRFGFPKQKIIDRVEKHNSKWLNTACSGAIEFTITPTSWQLNNLERLRRQKIYHQKYNHRCNK